MTLPPKVFTLCDTSPLIALIDKGDVAHRLCLNAIATLPSPMVTTWPCFTEAMYLLGDRLGDQAQATLWTYVRRKHLLFYDLNRSDIIRVEVLMEKYRDQPMDLADASLVATAEALDMPRIFTLDSDFLIYRFQNRTPFTIIPEEGLGH